MLSEKLTSKLQHDANNTHMYIIKLRIIFDARNSIIVADHYLTKETKIINQKRMQNFKIKPLKYKKKYL
jgi:hypothetical protein